MERGREGMTHGPTDGGHVDAGRESVDAVRLLATLLAGASAPTVTGEVARVETIVPATFLDTYCDWISAYHARRPAPSRPAPDASGAWSGVLLPAQREAARLLAELFNLFDLVAPLPAGGYRMLLGCPLATLDRAALWATSLDLIAPLFDDPPPGGPGSGLTAIEAGVPQALAGLVKDLYAAAPRPAPEAPGHLTAA